MGRGRFNFWSDGCDETRHAKCFITETHGKPRKTINLCCTANLQHLVFCDNLVAGYSDPKRTALGLIREIRAIRVPFLLL